MQDHIVRAMTKNGFVKAVAISSREITETARRMHKTLPTATAALGRLLAAASMMGNMQKVEDGSITLQIKGGGPLGTLLAVSDAEGNVRGWVENPQISLLEKYRGKLDVGAAVGTDGMLTVIRDLRMKEPYVGSVELVSGEIAEGAGGYIVQLLPGAPDETIDLVEAGIHAAGNVTAMLDSGLSSEDMLRTVLGPFEVEILETAPVAYRCYCSREKVERTLLTLGREELSQIVRSGETLHVDCQFCDKIYDFTPENVQNILNQA